MIFFVSQDRIGMPKTIHESKLMNTRKTTLNVWFLWKTIYNELLLFEGMWQTKLL